MADRTTWIDQGGALWLMSVDGQLEPIPAPQFRRKATAYEYDAWVCERVASLQTLRRAPEYDHPDD